MRFKFLSVSHHPTLFLIGNKLNYFSQNGICFAHTFTGKWSSCNHHTRVFSSYFILSYFWGGRKNEQGSASVKPLQLALLEENLNLEGTYWVWSKFSSHIVWRGVLDIFRTINTLKNLNLLNLLLSLPWFLF